MNLTKRFTIGVIMIVLLLNVGCSLNKNDNDKSISPSKYPMKEDKIIIEESSMEIEFNGTSNLEVIDYLLPLKNSEERTEKLTHLMIHFTSNALNNQKDPYIIDDTYSIFEDYGVSAHYVIGRQGEIYLFVEEDRIAYHAGKGKLADFPEYEDNLNHHSIGIELQGIGKREEMIPFITEEKYELIDPLLFGYTEEQYESLNSLLNDILERHPNIKRDRKHIVGHDEYATGRKTDPGSLFNWSKIGF